MSNLEIPVKDRTLILNADGDYQSESGDVKLKRETGTSPEGDDFGLRWVLRLKGELIDYGGFRYDIADCYGLTLSQCSTEQDLKPQDLKVGGRYNFKHQLERLIYMGQAGNWYQFRKVDKPEIWAEILETDLHLIEETRESA